jgi:hypothetical protein
MREPAQRGFTRVQRAAINMRGGGRTVRVDGAKGAGEAGRRAACRVPAKMRANAFTDR